MEAEICKPLYRFLLTLTSLHWQRQFLICNIDVDTDADAVDVEVDAFGVDPMNKKFNNVAIVCFYILPKNSSVGGIISRCLFLRSS